ncbi:hypothetical protein B0O80DRAFT_503758 [Mortierella sp. GBAus27b]|nr:hypothetical protein BGX31_008565 [Mortierella sp. GBA43]KAI8346020.1 hypothetical protein B0O80DRAFT_503758 [Mortierella sp. GBAus27b]
MGHKRKKFSERVADRNAKGYDDSPLKKVSSDTPKSFARIMFKKDSMERKSRELKQAQSSGGAAPSKGTSNSSNTQNTKDGKKAAPNELRIMPGERMGEFSRRVDEHMRGNLIKTTKDGSSTGSKKKKYFDKLKAKEKAKKLKAQEDKAYQEFETIHDRVRLNDVAQAPPTLTAVPKKRKNDEIMANKNWKNTPGEDDYDDLLAEMDAKDKKRKLGKGDDHDNSKGPKRSRLKNLTPAGRRIIEEERKQAIENYRLMKARRATEKNPGKDDDASAEE